VRIALVTVQRPGVHWGAEVHYDGLERALASAGHSPERVILDCDESTYEGILEGYRAARALDLSAFDAVISTKAPSYAVRHPNHAVYLIHTVRVFYDMFDSWTDGSPLSRSRRDRIRELDFEALSAVPDGRRFANGKEGALRLDAALGLPAKVLHPPLLDADRFHTGPFEHFLVAGRLHPWKRADLVLRAYLSLATDVPLLISGSGAAESELKSLAGENDRVRFLGDVDRSDLYDLFSRALAVPFTPVREDFGYVAIEAMLSGKPVITATDSGEPVRLVEDGVSGRVVAPEPAAIAGALDELLRSPETARRMGNAGRSRVASMRWPNVVDELLSSLDSERHTARSSDEGARTRVLVVDNQPIDPPIGGGRIRLFGLYSNLPQDLDPVYVGTYDWPGPAYRSVTHQGRLREITVPQSDAHFRSHEALRAVEPALGMDVTFPTLSFLSTGFVDRVAYEARSADVIVCSHPWVFPIVSRLVNVQSKPLVYDAHNVEGRLKRSLLPTEGLGREIAEMVGELEGELCERAAAVFACSEEDAREFVSAYGVDRERIHVLPNGTDVQRRRPATPAERRLARAGLELSSDSAIALFMGSDYTPNTEAARAICEQLAPKMPDVRFLLLGGCTSGLSPDELPANVTALGVVDDTTRERALAAADLAINPVSRGSGTNIKMLDFFCAGLPTVTTPIGARGLGAGAGTAYMVAELESFPSAIRGLLESPGRSSRISRAARRLAESRFDWRKIGAAAATVIRSLAQRDRPLERARLPATRPARVAVMSTWQTRCGIADYTASLVGEQASRRDWRIYAEAGSCGATEMPNVRRNWEIGLEHLVPLERDLEADAPDVLLVQHNPGFFREDALLRLFEAGRRKGVPVALTLHAAQNLRFNPSLASELERCARIYVHRGSDAEWLAARSVRSGVRVIPQGIPRLPERSQTALKDGLGLDGTFLIGHFGYLRPHKGVLELVDAFEELAREMPTAHLLLLCSEYPSPDSFEYRPRCERRIAASPFSARIHASFDYLSLESAGLLLQACDALAFPYHPSEESSSAAVRLGIASGRPIVVSDSRIFEELQGVAAVAPSIEPKPLAETIRAYARPEVRIEAEVKIRRFARRCDWARVASTVWGDLGTLTASRGRGFPELESVQRSA
jgi:glycosyltransferase involved in cell wall biosynthesis